MDFSIELPRDESPGELMKAYFTLMRTFGWDLYLTAHDRLAPELGRTWFEERILELKARRDPNWPIKHTYRPHDPSAILRDFAYEYDSPYFRAFVATFESKAAAKQILGTRNRWFHFGEDPALEDLREVTNLVHGFVISNDMHSGIRVGKLLNHLGRLQAGEVTEVTDRLTPEEVAAESFVVPADLPRPPIGGAWTGDIPSHRYRITRAGDVIDPQTMRSVRDAIQGDPDRVIRTWTAVRPRGDELWIADDGAVGGFIADTPRLLGYLNEPHHVERPRGFFTPDLFVVAEGEAVSISGGGPLPLPSDVGVSEGALIRVTTYGDLVVVDARDGYEYVGTIDL